MNINHVVNQVENAGVSLRLEGEKVIIRFPEPEHREKLSDQVAFLRARRDEVAELLRQRVRVADELWPTESHEAVQRFGQPHARLFPFIGRKVRTPAGPGTLIQVFADRVTVLLETDLNKCTWFAPGEISPAGSG